MENSLLFWIFSCLLIVRSVLANDIRYNSPSYGAIKFQNLGFDSAFQHVASLHPTANETTCSCTLNSTNITFSGTNTPLDGELSVHFRGPLSLKQFGYYVTDKYVSNYSQSGEWTRKAYYDSASQTADNVTFTGNHGVDSYCLGRALAYLSSNGSGASNTSEILKDNTIFHSDEEFGIFSTVQCEESGFGNDCGVYRDGIPAYHGFYGATKMFLFKFTLPNETYVKTNNTKYYNIPAIWLLNSHIPRTSQYPTSSNCSCWYSGCGEFDIFEVMNETQYDRMFTTLHTFQDVSNMYIGLQAYGHFDRSLGNSSVMMGGVIFDSNGTALTFMSNDVNINETINFSNVTAWLENMAQNDNSLVVQLSKAPKTNVCWLNIIFTLFLTVFIISL